jgi:DNA-dependent RNA polymerase auxiliary subunit epsilon
MASGIINSLDAFLTYRNTIGLLRQTIKEKGINMEQIEALNNKLKETEQQLETYKIILASKPGDAGGGGGGGKANNKEVEKLQLQLKDCEDQLKLAQSSKGDVAPVDVMPLQTRISELEAKLAMSKAYGDESKAESRITNCNQRKGLYQSALVVFKEYQNSNLESIKKEASQKVTEITAKLKKPPVGCE